MKKLEKILKRVFLSSLAGISINQSASANLKLDENLLLKYDRLEEFGVTSPSLASPKLVLRKSSFNSWDFKSHRSHRSHSSHRSHYSSSAGGSSNSNSGIKPGPKVNQNSNAIIQLGSRTLKKGMTGTDVTELINILLKKGYLQLEDGTSQLKGELNFDDIVEGALKKFQTDNGLTPTGICDSPTIYYLKNK